MTDSDTELLVVLPDRYGVYANVIDGGKVFRSGAKVHIMQVPGDPERALCYGMSLGGRPVEKWHRTDDLKNWRVKTVPAGHPDYKRMAYDERRWAQGIVDRMEYVRLHLQSPLQGSPITSQEQLQVSVNEPNDSQYGFGGNE